MRHSRNQSRYAIMARKNDFFGANRGSMLLNRVSMGLEEDRQNDEQNVGTVHVIH